MGSFVLPSYTKICIVVHDIDKAQAYYSDAFGWGPWQISELDLSDTFYKGKPSGCKIKNALFPNPGSGDDHMMVELIQPLEGESPFKDHLAQKGEGVQAVTIMVDDMDEALAELKKHGCEKTFYGRWNIFGADVDVAFVDAPLLGGIQYELLAIVC